MVLHLIRWRHQQVNGNANEDFFLFAHFLNPVNPPKKDPKKQQETASLERKKGSAAKQYFKKISELAHLALVMHLVQLSSAY